MILNGWKEIANYMGRGVRTVQRWESLGLPVRRPKPRIRSAVLCRSEEIDIWLKSLKSSREVLNVAPTQGSAGSTCNQCAATRTSLERLFVAYRVLEARYNDLRANLPQRGTRSRSILGTAPAGGVADQLIADMKGVGE